MPSLLSTAWLEFYKEVKGNDWPELVTTEEEILELPNDVLKELIFTFLQPNVQIHTPVQFNSKLQKLSELNTKQTNNEDYYHKDLPASTSLVLQVNDIKVFYESSQDGGGTTFGRRYPHVIKELYGNRVFENCFEWCSGPGFIGFELLSENICNNLYLADIYKPALNNVNKTIDRLPSKYQNKVHSTQIKGIKDLPADWKFDLIVANPPHWNNTVATLLELGYLESRTSLDSNWDLHREFFKNIANHLNDNAVILLLENSHASGPDTFKSMIEQANLSIKECYFESSADLQNFYYIEIEKQKDY